MKRNSRLLATGAAVFMCALLVTSCSLFKSFTSEGTAGSPVAVGDAGSGTVTHAGEVAIGGTSYYSVNTAMNHSYLVKITGLSGDADLSVFSDPAFSGTLIGSSTNAGTADDSVTAMASHVATLYVSVAGVEDADYTLSIADDGATASEGSSSAPLFLGNASASTVTHNGAANAIDSYYSVTGAAGSNTISMTGLSADLDLYVYSDAAFSALLNDSTSSGTASEVVTATPSGSGILYIRVHPFGGVSSTLILTVN